jgi:galactosamine-6-phosphate isomerase
MKIFVSETYEALSKRAVTHLVEYVKDIEHPLICLASGDSPAGLYKVIVEMVQQNQLEVSGWYFVGLDEWTGMNGDDEGSCRFHLNNQFFHPLQIEEDRICFFDGRVTDMQQECNMVEEFIKQHGGIDVAIVGLGMNGHVGMNEPGVSMSLRSHIAEIDPLTQQVGQKYFKKEQKLSHGLTLGVASIMEAREIMLVVNGAHKANIVKQIIEGEISEQLPASYLRNHIGLSVYLDKGAAQLISVEDEN